VSDWAILTASVGQEFGSCYGTCIMHACARLGRICFRASVFWAIYTYAIVENPLSGTVCASDASFTTILRRSSLARRAISTGSLLRNLLQLSARLRTAGSAITERPGVVWTQCTPAGRGEVFPGLTHDCCACPSIDLGSFVQWAGNAPAIFAYDFSPRGAPYCNFIQAQRLAVSSA